MSTTTTASGHTARRQTSGAQSAVNYVDDRVGILKVAKSGLRKVFPDHWSFLLGEIALYSFVILLLTGVFLTLWFTPSAGEVVYHGGYQPLAGVKMSQAYESSLRISFDIRGGLVIRQIHHWAALLFVASMTVHMFRVFFTGAFRKPREFNWVIGVTLLILGILEGFAGYSLPDDLLSGTGLRIAEGILLGIPVVGTYLSFFLFGGEFPGQDIIPRLYSVHILLVPGLILALITAHLILVVYQKHTQYRLPGRTNNNVVGYPLFPVYAAKAGGFFFIVFGTLALLGGFATINPIWLFGPYDPSQVSAGSQPDWYMGWLEGALRMMPHLETRLFGFTVSWNVLVPAVVLPGIFFTIALLYPFIEEWVNPVKGENHFSERPRNHPTRTGLGAMAITAYLVLLANGGNDILAVTFNLSINAITWTNRILLFVAPPIAFVVTKRICLGLQRRDRELVLHGRETGRIVRLPHGEFIEVHEPVTPDQAYILTAYDTEQPLALGPGTDANGIPRPGGALTKFRSKVSKFYFEDRVEPATPQELRELEGSHH
ncbi:MAG: cytochrome bc1 complex cytochrome b subunit [Actinomycetales bacterium]